MKSKTLSYIKSDFFVEQYSCFTFFEAQHIHQSNKTTIRKRKGLVKIMRASIPFISDK